MATKKQSLSLLAYLRQHRDRRIRDLNSREIAELLWLRDRWPDMDQPSSTPLPPVPPPSKTTKKPDTATSSQDTNSDPEVAFASQEGQQATRPGYQGPVGQRRGISFEAPWPLSQPLMYARGLHRMASRRPSQAQEFDLEASVMRSAEYQIPQLVLKPRLYKSTRLVLLFDLSGQLAPWFLAYKSLLSLVKQSKGFCSIEMLEIDLRSQEAIKCYELQPGTGFRGQERPLFSTLRAGLDHIYLLFTDGLGRSISSGALGEAFQGFPEGTWAIWIHPWPAHEWHRSSFSELSLTTPAPFNGLPKRSELPMEVLPLAPDSFQKLEGWLQGGAGAHVWAIALPTQRDDEDDEDDPDDELQEAFAETSATIEDVRHFARHADPRTVQLLALASAIPGRISVDLLHHIGQAFGDQEIAQIHVAKAMSSGFLKRLRNPDTSPDSPKDSEDGEANKENRAGKDGEDRWQVLLDFVDLPTRQLFHRYLNRSHIQQVFTQLIELATSQDPRTQASDYLQHTLKIPIDILIQNRTLQPWESLDLQADEEAIEMTGFAVYKELLQIFHPETTTDTEINITPRKIEKNKESETHKQSKGILPKEEKIRVVLVGSEEDYNFTRKIAIRLELLYPFELWFDNWGIKPGDYLPGKYTEELERADIAILCYGDKQPRAEVIQAIWGQTKFKPSFIPILAYLPGTKNRKFVPPEIIQDYHSISFSKPYDKRAYQKILSLALGLVEPKKISLENYITLENWSSFPQSAGLMEEQSSQPPSFPQGHALLISLYKFSERSALNEIAHVDVSRLDATLESCGYPSLQVHTLVDNMAQKEWSLPQIRTISRRVKPNNTMLVHLAMYGAHTSENIDAQYLFTHNDLSESIALTGLTGAELIDAFQPFHENRLLFIIDCYLTPEILKRISSSPAAKPHQEFRPGLSEGFYQHLAQQSPHWVVLSSNQTRHPWINEESGTSVFMHSTLAALQGENLTPKKSYLHVFNVCHEVINQVEKKTQGEQRPALYCNPSTENFPIAAIQQPPATDSPKMKPPWIPPVKLLEWDLDGLVINAGLPLEALLAGLPREFTSQMNRQNSPFAKLNRTIDLLNHTGPITDDNGTVIPFEAWLRNAEILSRPHKEAERFREIRKEIFSDD